MNIKTLGLWEVLLLFPANTRVMNSVTITNFIKYVHNADIITEERNTYIKLAHNFIGDSSLAFKNVEVINDVANSIKNLRELLYAKLFTLKKKVARVDITDNKVIFVY